MSTPVKQDAHPRETISVGNQTDDLKQNVPLETIRKALRKFLNPAGLITDSFPRESQSLQLKGVEFFGVQVCQNVFDLGVCPAILTQSLGGLSLASFTAQTPRYHTEHKRLDALRGNRRFPRSAQDGRQRGSGRGAFERFLLPHPGQYGPVEGRP
jgi:hypothetical protein